MDLPSILDTDLLHCCASRYVERYASRENSRIVKRQANELRGRLTSTVRLLEESVKNSTFVGEATVVEIPKPGKNSVRRITIPTAPTAILHDAIWQSCGPRLCQIAQTSASYGRKSLKEEESRGVTDALVQASRLRRNSPFMIQADIEAFFDNISLEVLNEKLVTNGFIPEVAELLCSSVRLKMICKHTENSNSAEDLITLNHLPGVGQGTILGPVLANIAMADADRRLSESGDIIRYVDDCLIFGQTERECLRLFELLCTECLAIGVKVHPIDSLKQKSYVVKPGVSTHFLGAIVSAEGTLGIPDKALNKFRTRLEQPSKPFMKAAREKKEYIYGWCRAYRHIPVPIETLAEIDSLINNTAYRLVSKNVERLGFTRSQESRSMKGTKPQARKLLGWPSAHNIWKSAS